MDITKEFDCTEGFLHWFTIAALSGVEITEEVRARPLNLTMNLNGSDLNVVNALHRLEQEMDRIIEEKVEERLEKFDSDKMDYEVLDICTAYEQGYGKGQSQSTNTNPYTPKSSVWQAWGYGYEEGERKSIGE